MFCENCGHKLPEDALFCPNCGHNLKHSNFLTNIRNLSFENKLLLSVCAVLVMFLVIAHGAMGLVSTQQDEAAVDDYTPSSSPTSDDSDSDTHMTVEEESTSSDDSSYSSSSSDYSEDSSSSSSGSGGSYVGSSNSNKFHYPSCRYVGNIKSSNLISFSSRDDALSSGYSPCKVCSP